MSTKVGPCSFFCVLKDVAAQRVAQWLCRWLLMVKTLQDCLTLQGNQLFSFCLFKHSELLWWLILSSWCD